jgi:hypothetical protein
MEEVDQEKKQQLGLQEVQIFTPWTFFMWRNAYVRKKKADYADTARVTYVIQGTDFTRLQRQ